VEHEERVCIDERKDVEGEEKERRMRRVKGKRRVKAKMRVKSLWGGGRGLDILSAI
jgi:hypothetical protein